jgi:hypothetical protein
LLKLNDLSADACFNEKLLGSKGSRVLCWFHGAKWWQEIRG